jgi:hypothetical protein
VGHVTDERIVVIIAGGSGRSGCRVLIFTNRPSVCSEQYVCRCGMYMSAKLQKFSLRLFELRFVEPDSLRVGAAAGSK